MKSHHVILPLMCVVLGATSASAQDKGRFGMAMGVPGSIAAIWHLSEVIAIRPEVNLARSSEEYASHVTTGSTTTPTTNRSTSFTTSVGVSGIFFVATKDNLRTYVSPQIGYTRVSITQNVGGPSSADVKTTGTGYSAGGSVGAQYAIGSRFGAYGELGAVYRHAEGGVSNSDTDSVSTRSAVGVIVYF